MPDQMISNPAGVWGYAPTINPTVKWFINGANAVAKPGYLMTLRGDVTGTVLNGATAINDVLVVGIVAAYNPSDSMNTQPANAQYAIGSDMPVITYGPARVFIGANTVALNDLLTSSVGVPFGAQTNAAAPAADTITGSIIAFALEPSTAKDANNTIRCFVSKV